MDKILKITSQQGFNFSKASNVATASKSLVDFHIPSNGVYNLKDSYVIFNVSVDEVDASPTVAEGTGISLIQFGVLHNKTTNTSDDHQVPNVALVRNAQMSSQNKGMIESIRRVNVLRCLENSYLRCYECRNAEDPVAIDTIRDANYQVYSPVRDVVKRNVVGGATDTTKNTRAKSHDIKIPLAHIFGMPNFAEEYNAVAFGQTHINLEMDFSRLVCKNVLGASDTIWNTLQGVSQVAGLTAGAGGLNNLNQLTMIASKYLTEEDLPFYIGQKVRIELHGTNGFAGITAANNVRRTITAIEKLDNTEQIKITFNTFFLANLPNTQGWDANALTRLSGVDPASMTINVNNAEIVLKEVVNPSNPQSSIQFRSHTVEEDNGNNLASFSRQYHIDEKCMNLVVAMPNCNDGLISNYGYVDYRIAINGTDQTLRKISRATGLDRDRKIRAYENLGKPIKNLSDTVRNIKLSPNYNAAGAVANGAHLSLVRSAIIEPMPITSNKKLVGLEINGGGLNNIILYKEVIRQV